MELPVAPERLGWVCVEAARVATEFESDRQRVDEYQRPLWQVGLLVLDGDRSAQVRMRVPYDPQVQAGQPVQVQGLSVSYWVSRRDGKERVGWACERLDALGPVPIVEQQPQQQEGRQPARSARGQQQSQQGQQQSEQGAQQ